MPNDQATSQEPYSAYGSQPTYQVQEEPEYLKALKNTGVNYNQGTNTLSRAVGAPAASANQDYQSYMSQPAAATPATAEATSAQSSSSQISPYIDQMSALQPLIQALQNMRPGARAAQEQETGNTLSSYLNQVKQTQASINQATSGTGAEAPQFDPLTGKQKTPEMQQYEEAIKGQQQMNAAMPNSMNTQISQDQIYNALGLQLLMNMLRPYMGIQKGMPNYFQAGQNYFQPPGAQTPGATQTPSVPTPAVGAQQPSQTTQAVAPQAPGIDNLTSLLMAYLQNPYGNRQMGSMVAVPSILDNTFYGTPAA